MAAWHEPPVRATPRTAIVLGACVYFGAMLGLVLLVLWKIRHLIAGLL